jgi:hypothetical protein
MAPCPCIRSRYEALPRPRWWIVVADDFFVSDRGTMPVKLPVVVGASGRDHRFVLGRVGFAVVMLAAAGVVLLSATVSERIDEPSVTNSLSPKSLNAPVVAERPRPGP